MPHKTHSVNVFLGQNEFYKPDSGRPPVNASRSWIIWFYFCPLFLLKPVTNYMQNYKSK